MRHGTIRINIRFSEPTMARLPDGGPINYLVNRKFPSAKALAFPPSLSSLGTARLSGDERRRLLQQIDDYRNELEEKAPEEIASLAEAERTKEFAETVARARAEEQKRFFNQPSANADYDHWCKASHWTLDEAVALSFGKAPEVVSWEKVQPFLQISPFAFQYHRKRDLCLRATHWEQLFDPVLPGFSSPGPNGTRSSTQQNLKMA
jgi:hypothetical protein